MILPLMSLWSLAAHPAKVQAKHFLLMEAKPALVMHAIVDIMQCAFVFYLYLNERGHGKYSCH